MESNIPPLNIILRGSNDYNNYFKSYNSRIERSPFCYIIPKNSDQCQEALRYAKDQKKLISVKSGGHSCCAYSVLDDRVVIDMKDMKSILELDVTNKTITVQSGISWLDFYSATTQHLLACPGGGCPTVAVGGLTLGGGSNALSASLGYALDNVIEIKVLLESGKIVTASKTQYQDLFWALRGAGHAGFAVALEFKFQLHDIPPLIYFNIILIDFNDFEQSLSAMLEYSKTMPKDVHMSFECRKTFKESEITSPIVKIIFFYIGDIEVGERHFQELLQLVKVGVPQKGVGKSKSFLEITKLGPNPEMIRRSFTKNRFISSKTFSESQIQSLKTTMTHNIVSDYSQQSTDSNWIEFDDTTNFSISIYYHGGKQNLIPESECSFIHRSFDWVIVGICSYVNEKNDNIFSKWSDYLNQVISKFSPSVYQNYPQDDIDFNWQEAYYGSHYQKLREIKSKYDPNNYFSHFQSIEPK